MASLQRLSIAGLLILQAYCYMYTSVALNVQETRWLTRHVNRPKGVEMRTRRLAEASDENVVDNGWRASLINTHHLRAGTENFTILQKIHHDVDSSRARARSLDLRARKAPYHVHKGRKTLQDFTSNVSATGGSYSMEFTIGTPPQTFVAIADTGSDLVWLQCSTCDVCFDSKLFDAAASTTYAPLGCPTCDILGTNQLTCTPNCQYTYKYGDESTTEGDFSTETVTLTSTNGTLMKINNFRFGCGLKNQGTFTSTDGLIGLARGAISFPSQIAPALGNVNKFSYCLLSRYDDDVERSPLIFGQAAVPINSTEMLFTPIQTPYETEVVPFYYVNLLDITVGGVKQEIPVAAFALDTLGNGGVIFDSGTTYTVLNTVAYEQIVQTFVTNIGTTYPRADMLNLTGLEVCYDISGASSVRISALVFNFQDADFDLPFNNIVTLFSTDGTDSYMCLALLESTGISIFGSFQQQQFQVLHDQDNLRIGWIEADCKSL